jgi:hypothetical protein
VQIANEAHRVCHAALSDTVRSDQLGFRVQRDKNPLIANFRSILFANLPLLLANKAPNLIALHIAALEILQLRIQQGFTTLPSDSKQSHDRIPKANNAVSTHCFQRHWMN